MIPIGRTTIERVAWFALLLLGVNDLVRGSWHVFPRDGGASLIPGLNLDPGEQRDFFFFLASEGIGQFTAGAVAV